MRRFSSQNNPALAKHVFFRSISVLTTVRTKDLDRRTIKLLVCAQLKVVQDFRRWTGYYTNIKHKSNDTREANNTIEIECE